MTSSEDAPMLSDERIDAYRRMTPEARWREVEELMTLAWRTLQALPEAERERRLSVIREEHDTSDAVWMEHLRRHS
jgi:hypothetical protein